MAEVLAFSRVRDPGGWMSNMSAWQVRYADLVWPTTEHLFQALRFGERSDLTEAIRAERSPMGAKMRFKALVRDGAPLVYEPRGELDLRAMDLCVGLKLLQHDELRGYLRATAGRLLVEDTTSRWLRGRPDDFWGAHREGGAGAWVGENHLGRIWMRHRLFLPAEVELV